MKTLLPVIDLTEKQMKHVNKVKKETKTSMAQYIRNLIDKDIKANNNEGNL